jgi:hypothetical protein
MTPLQLLGYLAAWCAGSCVLAVLIAQLIVWGRR